MTHDPTFLTLVSDALSDCFDASVLLPLLAGGVLLLRFQAIQRLTPLILSAVFASLFAFIAPVFPFAGRIGLFLAVWIPILALIIYSVLRRFKQGRADDHSEGFIPFAAHGIAILGFIYLLAGQIILKKITDSPIEWREVHVGSCLIAIFYLISEIKPWRLFSLQSHREAARILLYLALGLFVFRGGMWCYFLFHGALKERPGSFRLKGVVYSEQKTLSWRFPNLHRLMMDHWYYPISPDRADQISPVVRDAKLFRQGLQQAESFRQSLLGPTDPSGENGAQAELIAEAILTFQEEAEPFLQDRISLKRFDLDAETLIDMMRGIEYGIDGREAFGSFTGRWHGVLDDSVAELHWRPLEYFSPPKLIPGAHSLRATTSQYGWIGDGFGWNVIAQIPNDSDSTTWKEVILGIVYHVKNQDITQIFSTRPHLGLPVGEGQLIRITAEEILLEEIIRNPRKSRERCAVTGFKYKFENNRLTNNGSAFQAIFSRNPTLSESFYQFDLDLEAPTPDLQ
ncbi:MAG: hypothetical protein JXR73_02285 [Candidatus Omnitrophica bacterium]|nr:hypothetical protein [Candidatus Omnitrophota bacterium]